jgi:Zinc knuckle
MGGLDRGRYRQVIDQLNNDYLLGNTNYPESPGAMLSLLSNRRDSGAGGRTKQVEDYMDGMEVGAMATSFNQTDAGNDMSETSSRQMRRVICYACGGQGHIARECPKIEEKSDSASTDNKKKKKPVNAFMKGGDEDDREMRGWFPTSFD